MWISFQNFIEPQAAGGGKLVVNRLVAMTMTMIFWQWFIGLMPML